MSASEPAAPAAPDGGVSPEVLDLLAGALVRDPTGIARFETHAAVVLVGAREAFKVKRAVRYPYLDFSTLARRRAACEHELEINLPNAPDLYLGVVAVTREADGRLAIDGAGVPVEHAIRMRRFEQSDLLARRAEAGALPTLLMRDLAAMVAQMHARAPVATGRAPVAQLAAVIRSIAGALAVAGDASVVADGARLVERLQAELAAQSALLADRARAGFVRRCHGDLHLANIVHWQGKPQAFDAIEFDDELATIDVLYDLAFLLMDLGVRGHRDEAGLVLSRYLWQAAGPLALAGLAALPLFLAVRAGVRAMVEVQRVALAQATEATADARAAGIAKAARYIGAALDALAPAPAHLLAVGGPSGTGKSTLAATLAPTLGRAPGAVHLRTDLERKALLGVGETERLPAESYTRALSDAVYARCLVRAEAILATGHSVVLDAVFSAEDERAAVEALAQRMGAGFAGLWLSAPASVLRDRVDRRTGDASDATAAVVDLQIARGTGVVAWPTVDAAGSPNATAAAARRVLAGA